MSVQAIGDNAGLRCKCHGVSGSCEVKTCWRNAPSMRHVGALLLDKYDVAAQVASSLTALSPYHILLMLVSQSGAILLVDWTVIHVING